MGIEIEKKYRLKESERETLRQRLREVGATLCGEEFEENTIYTGHGLRREDRVLRLRRTGGRALLTYKERLGNASAIRHQREEETTVGDVEALAAILEALGYRPALVYEKRRETWRVAEVELVVDELPFGLFVEIEGEEKAIGDAEQLLGLAGAEAVHATYPELTRSNGVTRGDIVEARFQK